MIIMKIRNIIKEYEEKILFDTEAIHHWYEIDYQNNKLYLYEVSKHYNDIAMENEEIMTTTNMKTKIASINCTIRELTDLIIEIKKKEDYILKKIKIKEYKGIKNDTF